MWAYRGQIRPPFAEEPQPGQESVWDYPRPPKVAPCDRTIVVSANDQAIAETQQAYRVLETASPPSYYLPPEAVDLSQLVPVSGRSFCEWKGMAQYWGLCSQPQAAVGWSYPSPSDHFAMIKDYLSFYPARVRCMIDGEVVRPQPGHFYGGWLTSDIAGPVKGDPGTEHW